MINSTVQSDQSRRSLGEPDSKNTQLVETYEGRRCFTRDGFHTSMSEGGGETAAQGKMEYNSCLDVYDYVSWNRYIFI